LIASFKLIGKNIFIKAPFLLNQTISLFRRPAQSLQNASRRLVSRQNIFSVRWSDKISDVFQNELGGDSPAMQAE